MTPDPEAEGIAYSTQTKPVSRATRELAILDYSKARRQKRRLFIQAYPSSSRDGYQSRTPPQPNCVVVMGLRRTRL